jgi:predicted membrane protein
MLFRLFAGVAIFISALLGTACGNVLRVALDKKYRQKYITPDTDDLIVTGVVSNGLIAAVIAFFTGSRRLWCAFIGGALLTFVFGDRLDRNPDEFFALIKPKQRDHTSKEEDSGQSMTEKNGTTPTPEAMGTNGATPSEGEP